ncbi:MAG: AMP-binding protein [Candidatus Krumholzibacteriia bacterium]
MRRALLRSVLLPLGDRLAGQTVMRHLRFYERSQTWPRERILAEQDRRIRELIQAAWAGSEFYRDLFTAAGVTPADIGGKADLGRLPMVSKDMLREAYPDRVTLSTRFRTREYSTSGSTGRPFALLIDDDSMSQARALMLLRTRYAGWDFGEPMFQTGMAVERGRMKALKDRLLRVTYRSAYDLSPAVLDAYLEVIEAGKLRFLAGYAQSLHLLAERALAVGFNHRCRAAVTWGSNLLPQYRRSIRQAFGCETFDSYGVGEGMQIAAQSVHSGELMHQFCLHVAAEIVDREGQPVPDGERGEILLTRLNAGAMPLIRYRIGDMGRAAAEGRATGPINLPLWSGIDGRVSDIVYTPSGNQLIVEFFFGIFQYAPTITLFQVVQTRLDTLEIKICVAPDFEPAHWQEVADAIHAKGDPDLRLEMQVVGDIPLEISGKRRFVISRI